MSHSAKISHFSPPTYEGRAVGVLLDADVWKTHEHTATFQGRKVTMQPGATVEIKGQVVSFTLRGAPHIAKLNKGPILATNRSVGPFFDSVGLSLTPEIEYLEGQRNPPKITCIGNTLPPTPSQEITALTNASGNCSGATATCSPTNFQVTGNIIPTVGGYSQETHKEAEYDVVPGGTGEERNISVGMTRCWLQEPKVTKQYDVHKLSTLRECKHAERVKRGLIPIFWFGGLGNPPDSVCLPIERMKSGINTEWKIRFEIPKRYKKISFKWATEVRVIIGTTADDSQLYKTNGWGDFINWVKTIHRIDSKINISRSGRVTAQHKKITVVCLGGYEDQTIHKIVSISTNQGPWESHEPTTEELKKFVLAT